MNNKKTIKEWKDELKPLYQKQGSIYCKAVKADVVFNSHGWKHLIRHSNGQRRNVADAQMRLGLFPWVPEVIKRCQTVTKTTNETQIIQGRPRNVMYFELHHTFRKKTRKVHIIVILRRIADGSLHYWTVRYNNRKSKSS